MAWRMWTREQRVRQFQLATRLPRQQAIRAVDALGNAPTTLADAVARSGHRTLTDVERPTAPVTLSDRAAQIRARNPRLTYAEAAIRASTEGGGA